MKKCRLLFIIFFIVLLFPLLSVKTYADVDYSESGNGNYSGSANSDYKHNYGKRGYDCGLFWDYEEPYVDEDGNLQGKAWLMKMGYNGSSYSGEDYEITWKDIDYHAFIDYIVSANNEVDNEEEAVSLIWDNNWKGGYLPVTEIGDIFDFAVNIDSECDNSFGGWELTGRLDDHYYNQDWYQYLKIDENDQETAIYYVKLSEFNPTLKEKWIDKSETRKDPEVNTSVYRISKVYLNNNEIYNKDNDGAFKDENGNFDVSKFYYNGLTNWNYDGVLNNGENAKYNIIYQKVDYHKDEVTWERTYEKCTSHSDEYIKG